VARRTIGSLCRSRLRVRWEKEDARRFPIERQLEREAQARTHTSIACRAHRTEIDRLIAYRRVTWPRRSRSTGSALGGCCGLHWRRRSPCCRAGSATPWPNPEHRYGHHLVTVKTSGGPACPGASQSCAAPRPPVDLPAVRRPEHPDRRVGGGDDRGFVPGQSTRDVEATFVAALGS
jgi:hypothetical protein